ncbi:hypothetical protein [Synechococcus sp. PCC 7336]|uniref:hypothetical protein n=1 Tax=Synechococcus sp. PCC 7336 TaxID=195250 RepID=UPI00138AC924|nr:hypothetical protein [Synechococcus sp. PCC 7336]
MTPVENKPSTVEGRSKLNTIIVLSMVLIGWGLVSIGIAALEPANQQSSINIWLFVGGFSLATGFAMLSNRK